MQTFDVLWNGEQVILIIDNDAAYVINRVTRKGVKITTAQAEQLLRSVA